MVVSNVHKVFGICGIPMHLRVIFVVGACMVITWKLKVAIWCFLLVCAIMWGQCVNYIIRSHDQKKSGCTSFLLPLPKECSDAVGIT